MGKTVLVVAEKPSVAGTVATALSGGRHSTRGGKLPVHEFPFDGAPFGERERVLMRVTAVAGHLLSLDFADNSRAPATEADPAPERALFYAPVVKKVESKGAAKHMQREGGNGVDLLVLWLDCDPEGENISKEVMELVVPRMRRSGGGGQTVFRARFSSLTTDEIQRAVRSLGQLDENAALAVDARQELDLRVGIAFSRFQTRVYQGRFADLESSVLSYGPCQFPTLWFTVERHNERLTFQPETYWALHATVHKGLPVALSFHRARIFDHAAANVIRGAVEAAGAVRVTSVREASGKRQRPLPLNTVEMLKLASKALGMGPAQAMKVAERLYLSGYLSYPRSETQAYPAGTDLRGMLQQQTSHPDWGGFVRDLLREGHTAARRGPDAGDHPPITPVRGDGGQSLSGDQARLYELVTRHFIATLSPDARFLTTTARFECRGNARETFSAAGRRMIEPGFLAIVGGRVDDDQLLPEFREGEELPLDGVRLKEGQTSPPGALTEWELLDLMEKNRIGTDASMASHIQNVISRNYVELGHGRTLTPTDLGLVLINGYQRIDPDLCAPRVRAAIEGQCALVARGAASKEAVVEHALATFLAKFEYFVSKTALMDVLFEAVFSPLTSSGSSAPSLSKCGKCNRYMKYIHLRPQRLFCPTCNETYGLPQGGTIKLYQERRCPLDNFELVVFSLGNSARAAGKSFPLCPFCYNFPADEGEQRMGCNRCQNPACKLSAAHTSVCRCPEPACPGVLVLDLESRPNWKLGCNREGCNNLVRFQAAIHQIKVMTRLPPCETCASTQLRVTFHIAQSPLADGETDYVGCIVCDALLNSFTECVQGRRVHVKVARARRAGRGRGRGGRGRGGRGRGGRGGGRRGKDPKMSFEDF